MEIIITKGEYRNTLRCVRDDDSCLSTSIGFGVLEHDLAHYVVEKKFKIKKGFFGNINSGLTFEELSNKKVIKTLDSEVWLSEIMARNLQSLGTGVIGSKDFLELINWEAQNYHEINVPKMTPVDVQEIRDKFVQFSNKWCELPENEYLRLVL